MPKYTLKASDGASYTLDSPNELTPDQLDTAFSEALQQFQPKQQQPSYDDQGRGYAAARNFLNEATFGFGKNAVARLRSLRSGDYEKELAYQKSQLAGDIEQYPVTSVISGIGGAVGTSIAATPARVANWIGKGGSFLSRSGRMAAIGAPSGALYGVGNRQEGESIPEAAIRGGVTGAAFAPVGVAAGDLVSGGVRAVRGGVQGVKNLRSGTTQISPEQQNLTEAEKVIQAGKEAKIPIRTTAVMPPQSWLGKRLQQATDRIPVIGTGGGLVKTQEARRKATEDFVNQYVPEAQADPVWLKEISEEVKTKYGEKLEIFKEMKNTVLSKPEYNVGEPITTPNFLKAIDEEMAKIQKPLNAERKTIAQEKAKANATGAEYKPLPTPYETKMNELISLRGQATNNEGLGALETVRGDLSAKYATNPTMFDFANKLYPHLREDMGNFLKSQNPADYKKWKSGNEGLTILGDETKKTSLSRVINKGNVVPEAAKSLILSSKPSEVANINRYLEPAGRENAKKVIVEDLITRSTPKDSTFIDPDKFLQVVSQRQNQFKTFFSKQEQDALEGLTRALRATIEAGKYEKSRPWLQTLVSSAPFLGIGVGVSTKAAAGAAAGVGLAGRVYESKMVRDLLITLSKIKKNSPEEKLLINKIISMQASQLGAKENIKERK